MKYSGKWIFPILMAFLAVFLIDFNCTNMRPSPDKSHHIFIINFVVGGLLLTLLIFQINEKRL